MCPVLTGGSRGPADLPKPWRQKKEAPLPSRIHTISSHQTRQGLNRMPKSHARAHTGERHAHQYLAGVPVAADLAARNDRRFAQAPSGAGDAPSKRRMRAPRLPGSG